MTNLKPTPLNEEIVWDKTRTIKSRTDSKGIINYVNNVFIDVSEYSEEELIGQPHNIVRHPHMPKVIFKILWENLSKGVNFNAVVKNLTKTGKYYWIVTNFDIFKGHSGEPSAFMGVRNSVPDNVIHTLEPVYKRLLEIENTGGIEASKTYLKEYLNKEGYTDYGSYIKKLMSDNGVDVSFW